MQLGEYNHYNAPCNEERMVSLKTGLQPGTYQFGQIGRRQVTADFSGGQITSDAGLVLIAQLDRHYRIT